MLSPHGVGNYLKRLEHEELYPSWSGLEDVAGGVSLEVGFGNSKAHVWTRLCLQIRTGVTAPSSWPACRHAPCHDDNELNLRNCKQVPN